MIKALTFLLACLIVGGVLLLSGCTPVYVNRKVDVPVTIPCRVKLPTLATLPTDEPMPTGLTDQQKREWMLGALYRDIVLLEGELSATRMAAEGCH